MDYPTCLGLIRTGFGLHWAGLKSPDEKRVEKSNKNGNKLFF
jgi:hypothetical protein